MSLKNQLNFASGEIDPVLFDRVTLQRFQNGLETARNCLITKKGSITSRFSREHFAQVSHDGPIVIYSPPGREQLFEFGINSTNDKFYINAYDFDKNLTAVYEETTAGDVGITVDNIKTLQFVADNTNVYIFMGSKNKTNIHRLRYGISPSFTPDVQFDIPAAPVSATFTEVGPPNGYLVDYAITYVKLGEESKPQISVSGVLNKPIAAGESINIEVTLSNSTTLFKDYSEIRVYRRPQAGASFGLIGVSSEIYIDGTDIKAKFTDIGADADFTNGIQSLVTREGIGGEDYVTDYEVGTGTIYQGRLMLGNVATIPSSISASRPGFKTNFYRDFPYTSDSALLFKTDSEGNPEVLRLIDANGLIAFTSTGVFSNDGLLSITNSFLDKKGNWIIDENVPPILIPGALLFVDKTTNSIRQLVYSQELNGYSGIDQSVFSDHLFKNRIITSWCFHAGLTPCLIVTFSDGKFATFTFSPEHEMKAWTRHDSSFPIEQVSGTSFADVSFFVMNVNGTRVIEKTVPRYATAYVTEDNQDADKFQYGAFMDSISVKYDLLNVTPGNNITISPVTPDDWSGQLKITASFSNMFDPEGPPDFGEGKGNVGEVYRMFKASDKSVIDLEYVSTVDGFNIIVQPSDEFPSEEAINPVLYIVHDTVDGLGYLEGEKVSVMCDGGVIASPNNDSEACSVYDITVTGGEITLPISSAITVVGRPIVSDIQSLNVSTVEQSPTMIESLTTNKLYIRTYDTRGLFVNNILPEEKVNQKDGSSVYKMQPLSKFYKVSGVAIKGNINIPYSNKRVEVTIPGDWDSQGKISIRQVDPVHYEILSIIADINIETRSDR